MSITIHLSSLHALSPHEIAVGLTVENRGECARHGNLKLSGGRRGAESTRLRVPANSKRSATLLHREEGFLERGRSAFRAVFEEKADSTSEDLEAQVLPVMRTAGSARQWWRRSEPLVMDAPQFACEMMGDWWGGPDDLSARLYFGWSDEAFRFAAHVTDSAHHQPYPDGTMYHGDCVQLFLDVLKNGAVKYAENDDYGFLLGDTPLGPLAYAAAVPPDRQPVHKDVSLRTKRGPGGNRFYDLTAPEGSVKDLRLAPGTVVGVTVVVNDNDGDGRKGWLELTEEAGSTRDIRTFLNLVFCDEEFLARPLTAETERRPVARTSVSPESGALRGDGLSETKLNVTVTDQSGIPLSEPSLVRLSIRKGGGILSEHTVLAADGRASATLRAPIGRYEPSVIEAVPLDRPGHASYTKVRFAEDREHRCVLGRVDPELPGLKKVERAVARGESRAALEALLRHFRSRDGLGETAEGLRERLNEEQTQSSLSTAEEVMEQVRKGGSDRWDGLFSGSFRFARLAFWRDLGHSYVLTGDEKSCRILVEALREYSRRLPASINGHDLPTPRASLDIGLSLSNAVAAYRCLLHWPGLTPDDHARFLRLLLVMAYFIEVRHGPANWMTMEAAGLADFAFRFPEFLDRRRWIERVLFLCEGQVIAQVRPDGMHYEQSPGYHMCAMNSWRTVLELADATGVEMSKRFRRTLEKMHEVCLYLAQPDWRHPNLGDSGEGDVSQALARGAVLFGRSDFRFAPQRDIPRGETGARPSKPPRKTSVLLPDAGYCVMRSDWSPEARYMVIDYGPWGYPNGHSHEDSLSFTLSAFGRKLIPETGVFSYARDEWREYFAGAAGHNTCTVDGRGMGFVDTELLSWKTTRDYDFADGLHRGYSPVVHRRAVLFMKPDYWLLFDIFTGDRKPHTIRQHLHFMPSETVEGSQVCPATLSAWSGYRDANILIRPLIRQGLRAEKRDGWYCGTETDGAKVSAPEICYVCERRLPIMLATLLVPFRGTEPPEVEAQMRACATPPDEAEPISAEVEVRLPSRHDQIRLPKAILPSE